MTRNGYFGYDFLSWTNGMMVGGLLTNLVANYANLHTGVEQTAFYLFFIAVTAGLMRWEQTRGERND